VQYQNEEIVNACFAMGWLPEQNDQISRPALSIRARKPPASGATDPFALFAGWFPFKGSLPLIARVDAEHEANQARMAGSTQGLQTPIRNRDNGWRTHCLWKGTNSRSFAKVCSTYLGCSIWSGAPELRIANFPIRDSES